MTLRVISLTDPSEHSRHLLAESAELLGVHMDEDEASDSGGEGEIDEETYEQQIEALAKLSGIEFSKVESGMIVLDTGAQSCSFRGITLLKASHAKPGIYRAPRISKKSLVLILSLSVGYRCECETCPS